MNDRDHFASAALTGLFSRLSPQGDEDRKRLCAVALATADAMLAARGEQPAAPAADARADDDTGEDGPGDEYRWVSPGETLKLGDSLRHADGKWCQTCCVDCVVPNDSARKYRRRITTDHDAAPAAVPAEPAAGEVHEEGAASGTGDTRAWRRSGVFHRFVVAANRYACSAPGRRADECFNRLCEVVDHIVASYAAPPAAGVTLTDAEWWALRRSICRLSTYEAATLRGFLARAAKEEGL